MWIQPVLLALGLVALTVGAELLVRGASSLAARLGVSPLFVGLTVVGFGTSAPELFASASAAYQGRDGIAVGNVIGSNVFNIAAILGACALARPIVAGSVVVTRSLVWVVAATAVPFLALATGGSLGRSLGVVLIASLVGYVIAEYRAARREALPSVRTESAASRSASRAGASVVAGLAVLVVGSHLLVDSASAIAAGLGVPELVIGLTVVAAGTSMPELFTSLVAARRGEGAVAIGNVLGSNVFNVLGVLGVSCVVSPQHVPSQVVHFDAPVLAAVTLLLAGILVVRGGLTSGAGGVLLGAYAIYAAVLFAGAPSGS